MAAPGIRKVFDEEARGSTSPEAHAIWWLLGGEDSKIVPLNDLGRAWREAVREAVVDLGSEGTVILAWDRGLAAWARRLITGRGVGKSGSPSPAEVARTLEMKGGVVTRRYMIWPSAGRPRVALPISDTRAVLHWVQRSGVLGGGGHRLSLRFLARSPLLSPFIRVLIPGRAIVARYQG